MHSMSAHAAAARRAPEDLVLSRAALVPWGLARSVTCRPGRQPGSGGPYHAAQVCSGPQPPGVRTCTLVFARQNRPTRFSDRGPTTEPCGTVQATRAHCGESKDPATHRKDLATSRGAVRAELFCTLSGWGPVRLTGGRLTRARGRTFISILWSQKRNSRQG